MSARIGGLSTLVTLAALLLVAGCEGPPDETAAADPGAGNVPSGPTGPADVGTISMALTLGGGFQISQITYHITGNAFDGKAFETTGAINVAGSSTVSTTIGGIPLGTGYQIQLAATDTQQKLTGCTGGAMFDVPSAATVSVPVHMTCHQAPIAAAASVPVPSWARAAIAALLLVLGAAWVRRARAASASS